MALPSGVSCGDEVCASSTVSEGSAATADPGQAVAQLLATLSASSRRSGRGDGGEAGHAGGEPLAADGTVGRRRRQQTAQRAAQILARADSILEAQENLQGQLRSRTEDIEVLSRVVGSDSGGDAALRPLRPGTPSTGAPEEDSSSSRSGVREGEVLSEIEEASGGAHGVNGIEGSGFSGGLGRGFNRGFGGARNGAGGGGLGAGNGGLGGALGGSGATAGSAPAASASNPPSAADADQREMMAKLLAQMRTSPTASLNLGGRGSATRSSCTGRGV
eukprot:TRINITY_DN29549_c0_g1_i1.p1 TRINITY_DN29549_c0_g1~~TRINITY_DN29549_c0_g1_i1.p1  ORF type:complete len:276 (-),score=57.07 TRINITY_DN29549_c0_g1_i1:101-928(-)